MAIVRFAWGMRLMGGAAFLVAWALPALAQDRPKVEIVTQIGHSLPGIYGIDYAPDGRQAVSGGGKAVKLWDVATGRLLRTFRGISADVHAVAFSPDGGRVLSAEDKKLKLWNSATGELVLTFDAPSTVVSTVAFSPDGERVLASGAGQFEIRDAHNGQLLRAVAAHAGHGAISVRFSRDGKRVLSGADRTIKIWEAATGQLLRTIEGHTTFVYSVAFSPDETQILSGSDGEALKLWDVASGKLVRTFEKRPTGTVYSIAFSADGRKAVSGGADDKSVTVWDVATGKALHQLRGHSQSVFQVRVSPDGKQILSGSTDHTLKLWDISSGALLKSIEGADFDADNVGWVAVSPAAQMFATGRGNRAARLWDATSGRLLSSLPRYSGPVVFTPDGQQAVSVWDENPSDLTASARKRVVLWDAPSGKLVRNFDGHAQWVRALAVSKDGKTIASGSADKTIKLWDRATGRLLRTFVGHTSDVVALAFSPDDRKIYSFAGTECHSWEAGQGTLVGKTTCDYPANDTSIAISGEGRQIATGLNNGHGIVMRDAELKEKPRTLTGHSGSVFAVAISSSGDRLASGDEDAAIKLWDISSGSGLSRLWKMMSGGLLRTLDGHSAPVQALGFTPDARRVLSGSWDGTARLWDLESGRTILTMLTGRSGEWLSLTGDGFFDGSGQSGLPVHVVRGLEVFTIDQVHQSLYNPDLVRETLAGDPNGEVRKAAAVINLEKVIDSGPPPAVEIMPRAGGSQSNIDLVTLQAHITDGGKGVGRIEWRVNGITAAVAAKPAGSGPTYVVSQQLALDPGDNVVEAVAYNASDLLASPPARVSLKFTGSADRTKPKLHILAIGINAYAERPLSLAVKDARTFAENMRKSAGSLYGDVRVSLALDKDATRDSLDTLVAKMAGGIHPRDTFILFAAGHGTSDDKGRFFFIPQDYAFASGDLVEHAVGQERLQDWLANRIKAKRAIVLLDTCESGALVAGFARSRIGPPATEAAVGRLHEATGRPVLTAAATGQFAHEGLIGASGERHGVFTWAVLDALRKGDTNGNGTIELSELVVHVQNIVPKIAADLGGAGRAATSAPTFGQQTARFGSRGEDFVVGRRMQ